MRFVNKSRSSAWAWASVVVAVVGTLIAAAPAQNARQAARGNREAQWWKGVVTLPRAKLDLVVVFRPAVAAGEYTATIDIPVQGAKDLELVDVALTATDLRFTIPPPANAVFGAKRSEDGKTATGELQQHGMTFPLKMERITEEQAGTVGPERPQTPKPPFPYQQREVGYDNPKDGTKLAGTLTLPAGDGPHPAVMLITGSGAQDRDETIFGHKPFFVIADHLTRRGIAVLRVDDRGVGGSSGKTAEVTSEDFAADVKAGIEFLKKQPEIDARRIGLVGHSEGGIIAPLVAVESREVACIVLLAGSGLPGDKIMPMQMEAILHAAGKSEDLIKRQLQAQRILLERLTEGADEETVRAALRELVETQLPPAPGESEPEAEQVASVVERALPRLRSPWMRWFLRHDPRGVLKRVECPVLALIGGLDLQVPPKENLPEIEKALRAGGNREVTVKELAGLNHLFQQAKTGSPAEYGTIPQTIAPAALEELTNWLRKQFKLEE